MPGRFRTKAAIVLKGHVLNWPWRPRLERRRVRGEVTRDAVCSYLGRYVPEFLEMPFVKAFAPDGDAGDSGKIFSVWLQGEAAAPEIVKACWRSIRANSSRELVVLDSSSLPDWIELPGHVTDKWRRGLIRPAHFTDICRVALLHRYGGYWMDATDFLPAELPEWMDRQDFFVYMSGERQRGWYSFIQNCFIRGRRGNYLLALWLNAMEVYWEHENSAIDYFVHQLLFRKAVESDPEAGRLFAAMPRVVQDPTHTVWFENASRPFDPELFRTLTSAAAFQKTEYKSSDASAPVPGSFADALMKMYL